MAQKSKNTFERIKPLFLMPEDMSNIGTYLIQFAKDDYNKAIGDSLIDAKNDAEAISSFLLEFPDSPLTLQLYAKEIERLLLWCIHVAKLNISSLRRNDLMAYQDFLKNPEPKNVWISAKVKRQLSDRSANPDWRAFGKALSNTTVNKVITILDSFFNYLVQPNYLTGNPLAVDRRRNIMKELQVSQATTKGLMVVYMIALSFAQFFYGSYSDIHGRRKAILLSIVIAAFGFIISACSVNIAMLYFGRFFTALGTAGCPVISRALISDVFHDQTQIKKAFSYFAMSSQFSPAIAPVLGGFIQHYANWHWSFISLAILNSIVLIAIFKYMPESHFNSSTEIDIAKQVKTYLNLFKMKKFMVYSLQSSLIFVYTIGFYSLSPFVFNILGYNAVENGLFYAVYATGIVIGAFMLATQLHKFNSEKLFSGIVFFFPILFLIFSLLFNMPSEVMIIVFSFILSFLCGISAPLTLALCMEGFSENKGAASAMQSFIKMFFTGVALLACNFIELESFVDIMFIFLGISIVMVMLLLYERKVAFFQKKR